MIGDAMAETDLFDTLADGGHRLEIAGWSPPLDFIVD
jgi:hypothetical protein